MFPSYTNTALDFILMLVDSWPVDSGVATAEDSHPCSREGRGKGRARDLGPAPFLRSGEAPGKPQQHSSAVAWLELGSRRTVAQAMLGLKVSSATGQGREKEEPSWHRR